MRNAFKIKIALTVLTLVLLVVYNYDVARRGKSREQAAFEQWLTQFESAERGSDAQKYRLLEMSAYGLKDNQKNFTWSVSGVHSSYAKVERLLELIKESNVLTWGKLLSVEGTAPGANGVVLNIQAADKTVMVFAPFEQFSTNIAFQNLLRLMQAEATLPREKASKDDSMSRADASR